MATTASQDANQFEESMNIFMALPYLVDTLTQPGLRSQLMGAQNGSHESDPTSPVTGPSPYPVTAQSPQENDRQIDPSIAGGSSSQNQLHYVDAMVVDEGMDGGGGKAGNNRRELSTTKRAAQNRAAQRAFRQRKEAYISKLEKQIKDYVAMEEDLKIMQHENYQLREYILALQTRILETSDDLPPPPPRIHLVHPHEAQRHQQAQAQLAVEPNQQHAQQADAPSPQSQPATAPVPTAAMTPQTAHMSEAAVQQLQAAAAEADNLDSAAKTES